MRVHALLKNRFCQLAVGVSLVSIHAMAWAGDLFPLESIDFISSSGKTDIVLHTGSIVPTRKVTVEDNKLIFEIDQIEAAQTVKTNFTGANNISHVIMQPLSQHKLRVIVRGENLGDPTIAFDGNSRQSYAPIHQPDSKMTKSMAGNLSDNTANERAPLDAVESALQESQAQEYDALPTPKGEAQTLPENEAPISFGPQMDEEPVNLPIEAESDSILQSHEAQSPVQTNPLAKAADNLFNGDFGYLLPYGLLAIVLGGLALFIRRKVTTLNTSEPELEDVIDDVVAPKASFRARAQAYKQARRDEREEPVENRKPYAQQPARAQIKPKRVADPIGLGGLKQPPQPAAPSPANNQKQLNDALMAASMLQKQPIPPMTPAPKKQVVNQYQRQSASPSPAAKIIGSKRKPAEDPIQQELLRQEQARAREINAKKPLPAPPISQPKNFKKPAGRVIPPAATRPAAAPQSNGPLPGNPQVVDFLRNVAELMEKEGKSDLAKSIHKNLGTTP